MKVFKVILVTWIVIVLVRAIFFFSTHKPPTSTVRTPDGTSLITSGERHNAPPEEFRGIRWDSARPSVRELRATALKGCISIVDNPPLINSFACYHSHIDQDDIELYAQRRKVAPLFGVPISEQILQWSNQKFYMGAVYIHNYRASDLITLHTALIERYGNPTYHNEQRHWMKWTWADQKLEIILMFDPVAKPELGSNSPPETSLSLEFAKTE